MDVPGNQMNANPTARFGRYLWPVVWIAAVMALAAWGIASSWPVTYAYDLPDIARYLVCFEMAAGLINILWGAWLLGWAHQRASGFSRAFSLWHAFNVSTISISAIVTLTSDVFVFQASGYALPSMRIVVGFALMWSMREPQTDAVSPVAASRPSKVAYAVNTLLGVILGGAAGAVAAFALGALIAEFAEVSCFEGGCGYFAMAFGLAGLVIGIAAGAGFAIWLTGRGYRPTSEAQRR